MGRKGTSATWCTNLRLAREEEPNHSGKLRNSIQGSSRQAIAEEVFFPSRLFAEGKGILVCLDFR
jgi:hypothetical protein